MRLLWFFSETENAVVTQVSWKKTHVQNQIDHTGNSEKKIGKTDPLLAYSFIIPLCIHAKLLPVNFFVTLKRSLHKYPVHGVELPLIRKSALSLISPVLTVPHPAYNRVHQRDSWTREKLSNKIQYCGEDLESPCTARIQPVNLKEISHNIHWKMMLKRNSNSEHTMWKTFTGKRRCWKDWSGRREMTEDGWFDGIIDSGQLWGWRAQCAAAWVAKGSDTTEPNWIEAGQHFKNATGGEERHILWSHLLTVTSATGVCTAVAIDLNFLHFAL